MSNYILIRIALRKYDQLLEKCQINKIYSIKDKNKDFHSLKIIQTFYIN